MLMQMKFLKKYDSDSAGETELPPVSFTSRPRVSVPLSQRILTPWPAFRGILGRTRCRINQHGQLRFELAAVRPVRVEGKRRKSIGGTTQRIVGMPERTLCTMW